MRQLDYVAAPSKDVPDEWRCEAIDPITGECYVVIFSGPNAEERAEDFATMWPEIVTDVPVQEKTP